MKSKVRYLLTEKEFGSWSLGSYKNKFIKIFKWFLIFYIPIYLVASYSNNYLMPKDGPRAAIVVSGFAFGVMDFWIAPVVYVGSYPGFIYYFNNQDIPVDYIVNATKEDLLEVVKDEKYQSVVLVGHGSRNSWRAADESVTNMELKMMDMLSEFKKKSGEWIQLSCAVPGVYDEHLGEHVMQNKEDVYFYSEDTVGTPSMVADALSGFKYIKYRTEEWRKTPR